jgi:hypothetical protein
MTSTPCASRPLWAQALVGADPVGLRQQGARVLMTPSTLGTPGRAVCHEHSRGTA